MYEAFAAAARAFSELVRAIPESDWDGPGLGDWDLRALVGHTSRALITVSTYLQTTAEREDLASPVDYCARLQEYSAGAGAEAITERARQAGRDFGEDPAATVDALVSRVLGELAEVEDPLIEVIGGLGIRLSNYLPTRTFELAVHGLDISCASGIDFAMPQDVLTDAVVLAGRVAVQLGDGVPLVLAMTGRAELGSGFSVV